jgi:hypothetical protein
VVADRRPQRRPNPASTRADEAHPRCSHCGRVHDPQAWRGFELLDLIASDRVCAFATSWPDDVVIEVRRCTCGQVTARKASGPPAALASP